MPAQRCFKKLIETPTSGDLIYSICCGGFPVVLGEQLLSFDGVVFLGSCQNKDCSGICNSSNPGSLLVDIEDFDWDDWEVEIVGNYRSWS